MADKRAPTVDELLAQDKTNGKSWVPAEFGIVDGKYHLIFEGSIPKEALRVSSSGKSLITTVRADFGRAKHPMVVKSPTGDTVREFGSINVNLTLT